MTEATDKKGSGTTRLPEELKADLRKELAPFYAKGKDGPSFGSMLLTAWKFYKAHRDTVSGSAEVIQSRALSNLSDKDRELVESVIWFLGEGASLDRTRANSIRAQLDILGREYADWKRKAEAARAGTEHKRKPAGT
jgi:hypothetical protein